tara:strand:- start:788 stop:1318 length:531 start_codon:yes stop_codon:yes gene_type:complete
MPYYLRFRQKNIDKGYSMEVIMIAAMAQNRVIGNKNDIPWRIKEDFQHFQQHTIGHPIIMGRNTFKSLPGHLKDREHIILTRFPIEGYTCFESIKEALDYCQVRNYDKAFLIGGAKVYEEGLKHSHTILLTEIEKPFKGDTYFPEISKTDWKLTEIIREYSEENDFNYSFNTYIKK